MSMRIIFFVNVVALPHSRSWSGGFAMLLFGLPNTWLCYTMQSILCLFMENFHFICEKHECTFTLVDDDDDGSGRLIRTYLCETQDIINGRIHEQLSLNTHIYAHVNEGERNRI